MADELPEGVQARINTVTAQRTEAVEAQKVAELRAKTVETELATLQSQMTIQQAKMEGFAELTQSNATLTTQLEEASQKYSQLTGMVSAGFTSEDDRDLAAYYHGKAGGEGTLVEYAAKLNLETAPKGLAHLFGDTTTTVDTTTVDTTTQKTPLKNSSEGTVQKPTPTGEVTASQVSDMTLDEYREWRKTQPFVNKA